MTSKLYMEVPEGARGAGMEASGAGAGAGGAEEEASGPRA